MPGTKRIESQTTADDGPCYSIRITRRHNGKTEYIEGEDYTYLHELLDDVVKCADKNGWKPYG